MDGTERQLTRKAQIAAASGALVALLDKPLRVIPTCSGISKSKFVAGLQCAKRLFLQVHKPHLAKLTDQANKDQGTALGVLARNLFLGGALVDVGRNDLAEAVNVTQELVKNAAVPAIFEATFKRDGVLVQVDVLLRDPKKYEFHLIEVKGSTTVKPYHLHDLSIQRYVLQSAGIRVRSNHLMHVNPGYVFDGDLELSKLFMIEEIQSDRLLTRSTVSEILNDQYKILSQPEPPDIETGSFCKNPYRCEFFDHCHPVPDQDDVRSLPISADKIRILLQNGLTSISQLPTTGHLRLDWHFTGKQCSRIDAVKRALTSGLSVDARLQGELAAVQYPACFVDFETVAPAVPRFGGMKPYEPIPVQWSVHCQEHEGGMLEHCAFLSPERDDPRLRFIESLVAAVAGARSIVVYGSYEDTQLSNLSRWLPEYASEINSIRSRLLDLLSIIRRNVYSPAFLGSYSIKRVLPALVPGMRYDNLAVASGDQVRSTWDQLCATNVGNEKARLRKALADYCAQDTLALAHLVDVLKGHADPRNCPASVNRQRSLLRNKACQ